MPRVEHLDPDEHRSYRGTQSGIVNKKHVEVLEVHDEGDHRLGFIVITTGVLSYALSTFTEAEAW